ncbi:NAD(P)-dependent oxidoreductase [Subtercola vilae]|uniref:NAD(P)-dependent oxidoreductase n=1 Tax=Subtercola vilae TaxID=2056433 RepID=A0A4T2BGW5_9MICO|nr:NAD(P)-dependent oxidoreductase [Subtercola vilae]TIH29572.1 NAD(P)-dependent oxidoreductase [Subtercola vilae]
MTTLFIGLGKMGGPMARQYAAAFNTTLYDVGPAATQLADELGVRALETLDTVPEEIDTVILMVPNSRIVESIMLTGDRLLEKLPEGALVIDMSSSVPTSTQMLAARAAEHGIGYVDAPVSGGTAKAVTGQLAIIVGGEPTAVERAMPHLEPMAGSILVVGPSGSGHAAKALNNLLSATNIAAAAEILTISTKFGIDPAVMVNVLNASTGRSQATEVKFPKHILTGTWDSGFGMDLMIKDLGIARDLAAETGTESPLTATTFEIANTARETVGGELPDHTELARYYELRNDITFTPSQ